MPIVTIKFQLPHEQEALEAALIGGESLAVIKGLRVYLAAALATPGKSKEYRRALEDTLDELARLDVRDEEGAEHGERARSDEAEARDNDERETGAAD